MKFWVDMDNAPHVHVLRPLIAELEARGHRVEITARDYGQTLPLLRLYGLSARRVGRHGGKSRIRKYIAFVTRTLGLIAFGLGRGFDAALCHGSRSIVPAAHFLRVPLVSMGDYEHTTFPNFMKPWIRLLLVPEAIPLEVAARDGMPVERVHRYPGLKEDLYVHDFTPDPSFLSEMGIDPRRVLVLLRPPATMAHYAVRQSSVVFEEVLDYLAGRPDAQVIVLPRTCLQDAEVRSLVCQRAYRNVIIPGEVYNGPDLVWYSDLVISGGGTMNREAAVLGVPVYSIYQGPIGAVDRHLIETGRLVHVKDVAELRRIPLCKTTPRQWKPGCTAGARVKVFIVSRILETATV